MEELAGQLLLLSNTDFDAFGEAGFFVFPAEGADDVDDLILVPQAQPVRASPSPKFGGLAATNARTERM